METLTITKRQLEAALLRWTQDARDGKTRTHGEADSMPVEHVAAESAAHLWAELSATASGRCVEVLQVTRSDVSLAADELTEQEWLTCKGLLRLLQYRIGAPGSDITFATRG